MFDKIKGKLKNVFSKGEEIIEENPDEIVEVETKSAIELVEEPKEEKKGFFSRFRNSDKQEEAEELEKLEDEMLKGVDEKEKKAILEGKEIENTKENLSKLEKKIEKEELVEKEELKEIKEESEGIISRTFKKLKSKKLDTGDFEEIWIELEIFLLEINIAYEIVEKIEAKLRVELIGNSFDRFNLSKKIREVLVNEIENILIKREADLIEQIKKINNKGEIARLLILGVNGTGKTTTIAKIARVFEKNNLSFVVAAADTFRAAAVEQLDEHSKKVGFKLIKHKGGSDPAAVAFDAIEHAKAKNLNIVMIDTAGRMPNNSNLMQELNKIQRISNSQINIFIGDSISGNDLIEQIELFDKIVGINGLILTKTDTDERPGSVITAAYTIEKPMYYLGVGQNYDDLVKFDAKLIAEKLFEVDED